MQTIAFNCTYNHEVQRHVRSDNGNYFLPGHENAGNAEDCRQWKLHLLLTQVREASILAKARLLALNTW